MKHKRIILDVILTLAFLLILSCQQFNVVYAADTVLDTELVANGGGETGSISSWTDDTGAGRWSSSAAYSDWALPAAGSYYFFLYNPSMDTPLSGTMSQVIALSGTEGSGVFSAISAGNISIRFSVSMFQKISADNEAKVILEEYDAGGSLLKTSQLVNTTLSGTMGSYQISTQVNPGTRKFKVLLSATLTRGGYAQFDKVSLKLVDASSGSAPAFGSDFPTAPETYQDATYGPVSFTMSDADAGDVDKLTFSASSTNVGLAPVSNITFGGSGANRTMTIVPTSGLSGESDITVTATDGTKSAEKTFHFTVHKIISMNTNLVENGNATTGTDNLAGWSGSDVNITGTGNGFSMTSYGCSMYQNIDISKYDDLIDGGESVFLLSATFPGSYGRASVQFYTDIACTSPVGSLYSVNNGSPSLQQNIPAGAKGAQVYFFNTDSSYTTVIIRNISFKIVDNFPKISAISNKTTNLSEQTVPVYAYYDKSLVSGATLTATSSDQTVVPSAGITASGSDFNRTIKFTPLKNGSTTITLTLTTTLSAGGTKTASSAFSVTAVEPAVITGLTSTAGIYAAGNSLDFTVQFNHDVTGGTGSTLPLTIGGDTVTAVYNSSSANSITYRYMIADGDSGVVEIGSAIDDSSSPITDTAGFDATMTVNAGATGITVVQAPAVTSSSGSHSSTYGDSVTFTAALTCTESLTGTMQFKANGNNIGTPVTVSGNQASYTTVGSEIDAGSSAISAVFVSTGANARFSSLTSNDYSFTVNKKEVTISGLSSIPKVYDGTTAVSLTGGTIEGVLSGDSSTVTVTIPTAGTASQKTAGTQTVAFSAIALSGSDAGNYDLLSQPSVSVVISPKTVTPSAVGVDKVYDGTTAAAVQLSFDPGDIITGDTVSASAIGAFADKNAGSGKTVTLRGFTLSGADKDSYTINAPNGITADISTLSIEITPDPASKVYGQADPVLAYQVTSGSKVSSDILAGSLARAPGENVGDYAIAQGSLTNANNPNYNISFVNGGSLTITQATPVITVSANKAVQMTGKDVVVSATLNYPNKQAGDAYPAAISFAATNAAAKSSVTVSDNVYSQTFTMGSDLTTGAAFSATVAANGNYKDASSAASAIVAMIDKYTPTVAVGSDKTTDSSTYGDTVVFNAAVTDSNGTPKGKVQFYIDGVACGSEVALTGGTASITVSTQLTAGGRDITARYTPAADETDYQTNASSTYSFTVDKRPVSIVGLAAVTRVYDGTKQVALTGGAISGAVTGTTLNANIPVTGTVSTKSAETGKSVSFTTIVLSGVDKGNYILSSQPTVTAAITPKTVTAVAAASDKIYDGTTTAAVQISFTPGDIISGDTVSASANGAFTDKNMGAGKTVSLYGFTSSGADKDNYSINAPSGVTADISALSVEVTPDAASKEYGRTDPVLTYQLTSGHLISGESLNGVLSRASGENTGSYVITQGTLTNANNTNYSIDFVSGPALAITKAAPAIAVSNDKSSGGAIYGDTITLSASVSGAGTGTVPTGSVQFLIDGTAAGSAIDLLNGTASTTIAAIGSKFDVGNKNVTAEYTPAASDTNYKTRVSAVSILAIGQKAVTVIADNKTIYIGDAIPTSGALTYSVAGFVAGESLIASPTLSLPANATSSAVTTYAISVAGATAGGNYTVNMVDGTLSVAQKSTGSGSHKDNPVPVVIPPVNNVVTATTDTTANLNTDGSATATVTSSQMSQAITAVLSKAAAESENTKAIVEIQVRGVENASAVTTTIPQTAIQSLTNQQTDGLKLNTPVGTVTFDDAALSAINEKADGNVDVKIERLNAAVLSEETKAIVGDRPVFDFTVTSGSDKISSFGEGSARVSVPYTIKDGEDPNKVVVYYVADSGELTLVTNCVYDPQTGAVTFTTRHFSAYAVGYNGVGFNDVKGWYKDYVNYLAARQIINGVSSDTFSPNSSITRAQFVTILANMAGIDPSQYKSSSFSDVKKGAWYSGAVQWAYENGIVTGANGKFKPKENISREQLAVMLYNYAKLTDHLGSNADSKASANFRDTASISKWAKTSINWSTSRGILNGNSGGLLQPKAGATRAEAAKMITVFLKGILQ